MTQKRFLPLPLTLLMLTASGQGAGAVYAQSQVRYAAVWDTEGEPQVQVEGRWKPLFLAMKLYEGDRIRTPSGSTAVLAVIEGIRKIGQLKIRENSEMVLEKVLADSETGKQVTVLDIAVGSVLLSVGTLEEESSFTVRTPVSTSGVRGTDFSVNYDDRTHSSETKVYEGTVFVSYVHPETREPTGEPVAVQAGMRLDVEAVAGLKEPSPLPPEEMSQTLRELEKLKIHPQEQSKKEARRVTYSTGSFRTEEATGSVLPRLGLFLLSIGLVLFGLLSLRDAIRVRSLTGFLIGCAMIAAGVWLFWSNKLHWTELPQLTQGALTEARTRLLRFR